MLIWWGDRALSFGVRLICDGFGGRVYGNAVRGAPIDNSLGGVRRGALNLGEAGGAFRCPQLELGAERGEREFEGSQIVDARKAHMVEDLVLRCEIFVEEGLA